MLPGWTNDRIAPTNSATPRIAWNQRHPPRTAPAVEQFFDAGDEEHDADQDADGVDRMDVEAEDDEREDDPEDPEDQGTHQRRRRAATNS